MKSIVSFLVFGTLLAINGATAAPVPEPARVVTLTQVVTVVVPVTSTKWVDPSPTPKVGKGGRSGPDSKEEDDDEETSTTSTYESTSTSTSETTSSTSTTEVTTSTTTTSSTTTEETTEETTPTPTPTTTEEETTTIEIPTTTAEDTTTAPPKEEPTITTTPPPPPPVEVEEEVEESTGGPLFPSHGEATYYDPGMGSCGTESGPGELIAAISFLIMDPLNPGNPNNNPLCGKQLRCTRGGKNPTLITVVDRCPGCSGPGDVDLSPAAYEALGGTIAEGRFEVSCQWA